MQIFPIVDNSGHGGTIEENVQNFLSKMALLLLTAAPT